MEPMTPSHHLQIVQTGWTWEENKASDRGRNYCCCSCSCFGSPSLSYISRLVAEAEFTAAPPASTLTPSHYQYIPVPVAEIIVVAPAHALALPHYHTSPG
ncbi:hypothetical protein ACOSQ3_004292 [Xanthoceras sorbifolium]